ncbi:MAG: hypothetical protein KTR35_12480 [Gammaproteobacteria bacterium]|nr:hypothetical protein [Gammaproteobacteria bacterium]
MDMLRAIKHCEAGIGIWPCAGTELDGEPEVVMGCACDVPTMETITAVLLLSVCLRLFAAILPVNPLIAKSRITKY